MLVDLSGRPPDLAYHGLESQTLFLQTPYYTATANGTTLMAGIPKRRLATYHWSEEADTFVGPTFVPRNTWTVIDRK